MTITTMPRPVASMPSPQDSIKQQDIVTGLPTPMWVRVTPAMAEHWLTYNVGNRKIRPRHLATLIAEMWKNWQVTPDCIGFDSNGTLINGQHRLTAIVDTGQEMVLGVVFGLDPDVFAVLDTQATRSAGDTLYINGVEQPIQMAVAARWIYKYLVGDVNNTTKITNQSIKEIVEANPGIQQSVQFVKDRADGSVRQDAILTGLHFLFAQANPVAADHFIGGILQGGGDVVGDDPRLNARKRLVQNRLMGRRRGSMVRPPQVMAEIIKCWNAYMAGHTIRSLRWLAGEPFPVISGLSPRSIPLSSFA